MFCNLHDLVHVLCNLDGSMVLCFMLLLILGFVVVVVVFVMGVEYGFLVDW